MHIYVAVTKMYRLFSKIVYCKKIYTDVILELGWGGGRPGMILPGIKPLFPAIQPLTHFLSSDM